MALPFLTMINLNSYFGLMVLHVKLIVTHAPIKQHVGHVWFYFNFSMNLNHQLLPKYC